MKIFLVVSLYLLGACVLSFPGPAEALEPSDESVSRPASSTTSESVGPLYASSVLAKPAQAAAPSGGDAWVAARSNETYEYRRRPRPRYYPPDDYDRRRYRRSRGIEGYITLRGGFYDTEDVGEDDWTAGLKVTGLVQRNLQLGFMADLHRRSDAERVRVVEDPTGTDRFITVRESSSNLIPVMALAEVHFSNSTLSPYIGVAGGWEFLIIEVEDVQQGIDDQDDFDGPGFQLFGGVAVPLGSPRTKLVAEGYMNKATVEREVEDIQTGVIFDEQIDVDGVGLRAGLSFAF